MLWGSHAQKKAAKVDTGRHLVLKAPHPSPLSAHNSFFGCRHFSKANDFLKANGQDPIDWSLPLLTGPPALDAIVPPSVVDPRAPISTGYSKSAAIAASCTAWSRLSSALEQFFHGIPPTPYRISYDRLVGTKGRSEGRSRLQPS